MMNDLYLCGFHNYADFLDDEMEPFDCQCGAKNCRGKISGQPGNSLNLREKSITG